jgi:hypothetical protein
MGFSGQVSRPPVEFGKDSLSRCSRGCVSGGQRPLEDLASVVWFLRFAATLLGQYERLNLYFGDLDEDFG